MMAIRSYRLSFQAPFHVDSQGTSFYVASESFIHSDTLSAALLSTWALLEPSGAEERAAKPPFLISSAFPWFRQTYFLPRPVFSHAVIMEEGQLRHHQRIKNIRWLSHPLWRKVVRGEYLLNNCDELHLVQEILALPKSDNIQDWPEDLWKEESNTRLVLDRGNNQGVDGLLFDFARIHFHPDGGLYFLARVDDKHLAAFHATLSLLADQGLGADRNVGNGWFHWEPGPDLSLVTANPEQSVITLSLLNPGPDDMTKEWLKNAAYDLTERGGWIGQSAVRRQPVRFFVEGSRFSHPMQGRTVNVLPTHLADNHHPVYRDGRGFCVALA